MMMKELLTDFDKLRAVFSAPKPGLANVVTAVAMQEKEFTVHVKVSRGWRTDDKIKATFSISAEGGSHEGDTLEDAFTRYLNSKKHPDGKSADEAAIKEASNALGQEE